MIFPILSGLVSWRKAPVTWALVILNLFVLLLTSVWGRPAQEGLEDVMRKNFFVQTQGRLYARYLSEKADAEYPDFLIDLAKQVEKGRIERSEMLGQLAFRDLNFLAAAKSVDFRFDADPVAFELWRKEIGEVERLQGRHPSFNLGLNASEPSFERWISYIFVHSGWIHFVGNMIFLLIFGAALEMQVGGLGLLVVFLLSGTFAAGIFALMTGMTSSPLVGASGAISGIMTLFCVLNWRSATRYFYWLFLPFRGFMGFVYLPAWVAFLLWAINDMAGYLGTVPELGGIAHTAHLGGEAAGLLTGLILFSLRRLWPVKVEPAAASSVPIGVLIPLLPREQKP